MNETNEKTREIIFEQLQLLQTKTRDVEEIPEIVAITSEMHKLANVLLSKNFN